MDTKCHLLSFLMSVQATLTLEKYVHNNLFTIFPFIHLWYLVSSNISAQFYHIIPQTWHFQMNPLNYQPYFVLTDP